MPANAATENNISNRTFNSDNMKGSNDNNNRKSVGESDTIIKVKSVIPRKR